MEIYITTEFVIIISSIIIIMIVACFNLKLAKIKDETLHLWVIQILCIWETSTA